MGINYERPSVDYITSVRNPNLRPKLFSCFLMAHKAAEAQNIIDILCVHVRLIYGLVSIESLMNLQLKIVTSTAPAHDCLPICLAPVDSFQCY